jgi:hypothetical protein
MMKQGKYAQRGAEGKNVNQHDSPPRPTPLASTPFRVLFMCCAPHCLPSVHRHGVHRLPHLNDSYSINVIVESTNFIGAQRKTGAHSRRCDCARFYRTGSDEFRSFLTNPIDF